jgi:3-deoxy-D-manno-octulosonic-acid transferase
MEKRMLSKVLYNALALPLATAGAHALAPFNEKIREALHGRRNAVSRWKTAAGALAGRPVWFHVSSVGEYEQAKPVISSLAADHPGIPVVISFCSPSGYRFARRKERFNESNNIKFIDYLPLDSSRNARSCLAALQPRLLVFVKFDLWPNLIWQAASLRIPMALIDGTLSASSRRLSAPARRFYRDVYDCFNKILAIGEADAARFRKSAPNHRAIRVTGDTRFDRVMDRAGTGRNLPFHLPSDAKLRIIAGSTWPKDETHILPAFARLLKHTRDLQVIIAPHEPSPERVASIRSWASHNGQESCRLSELGESGGSRAEMANIRVVVVDSVGILAELYRTCDAAYVGGSFSTGVHSVIEPAIMGIPVVFGPVHDNSLEALELVRRGGGEAVLDAGSAYHALKSLVENGEKRSAMGRAAKSYVESQLGATRRCMEQIAEYL